MKRTFRAYLLALVFGTHMAVEATRMRIIPKLGPDVGVFVLRSEI